MSLKKVHDNQPKEFYFSEVNLKIAEEILKKLEIPYQIVLLSDTFSRRSVVEPRNRALRCHPIAFCSIETYLNYVQEHGILSIFIGLTINL